MNEPWKVRGLSSCLRCRRAVLTSADPFPVVYDPTIPERFSLWKFDGSLTFGPQHPSPTGGGFHVCFPHLSGEFFC